MLKKSAVENILAAALESGADFAEIYAERTKRSSIAMVNGKVETALGGMDYGAGVRLFFGNQAIYGFTNDLSEESLIRIAREGAAALRGDRIYDICGWKRMAERCINPIRILPESVSKQRKAEQLRLASSATEKQSGHLGPGGSEGYELFDRINVEDTAREAARIAVTMLGAKPCPAGKIPVVIDNGFGGVIFHEACGHGLEATAVARNASVFAGRLGQQIASPLVTALDDGTIPNGWGSAEMDDEGTPTAKNILIENGILRSYLVDRLNSRRMHTAITGSSRRQDYRFAPTSRMTNTFIANGKSTPEEIIANTEFGLYAKQMGGGSVDPATGSFNFAVLEGYMIRNGRIAEPVRGATLIGKGAEVLRDIDMVGNNLKRAQGMCGSKSGSIPTDVGQPMIRVSSMTVGGRG